MNYIKNQEQLVLPLNNINQDIHLEDAIVGTNYETIHALKKFLSSDHVKNKSFILWGPEGSGKTFWLRGWSKKSKDASYYNLNHDILTQNYQKKILILDNLDNASAQNQSIIFKMFNIRDNFKTRILGSISCSLNSLGSSAFRYDLLTRFKQGLVYKLNSLSDEHKKLALKEYLYRIGWLSTREDKRYDSILDHMLKKYPRQLPLLKLILANTNKFALSNNCQVTIQLINFIMEKTLDER